MTTATRLGNARYAFQSRESRKTVFTFDVTNPIAPKFARDMSAHELMPTMDEIIDHDVESVVLVSTPDSLFTGEMPMRIVGNQIGGTIAVFSISAA